MNNPTAIQIVPFEGRYLILYYDDAQREAYIRDGTVDDEIPCTGHTIPDGFEIANIFIDLKAGGKVTLNVIEKE